MGEKKELPTSASRSFLEAAWNQIVEEPAKGVALAYFWLTAIGFTRIFGAGVAFGINAVDLASPSDFLLAGLRDPFVLVAAGLSAGFLYWIWGKALTLARYRRIMPVAALGFLALGVFGSCAYRRAVVAGGWKESFLAPLPMHVTLDTEIDGRPVVEKDLRLVLSTAGYLILHRGPNETVVLRRDAVKRIDLKTAAKKEAPVLGPGQSAP